MKRIINAMVLTSLGIATAFAQEAIPTQYDSLLKRLEFLEQQQAIIRQQQNTQKDTVVIVKEVHTPQAATPENNQQDDKEAKHYDGDPSFKKYRIGSYGEMLVRHKDYSYNRWGGTGTYRMDRSEISIPRFTLGGDYKFSRWFQLGAEIEFEAGGVGTEWEQETGSGAENGELESEWEKGGEVALEQFHITVPFLRQLNLRMGHIIVPVGITNTNHEPIFFFGTSRPEGETYILPSTWHETGIEIYGTLGHGYSTFDYSAELVNGLTVDGFDKYKFLGGAKQGLFEQDVFSSPALVGRLDYKGIAGLRIGGSFYWCDNAGKNSNFPHYYSTFKVPVHIFSGDVQYTNRWITARANAIHGSIGNTTKLTRSTLGRTSAAYSGNTPVAKYAVSYGGELGVNAGNLIHTRKPLKIYPFVRYEYYNPQEKLDDGWVGEVEDPRCQVAAWTFGVNWYALPYLVVKGDWTTRHIGTHSAFDWSTDYNSENDFSLGVAYVAWFNKK